MITKKVNLKFISWFGFCAFLTPNLPTCLVDSISKGLASADIKILVKIMGTYFCRISILNPTEKWNFGIFDLLRYDYNLAKNLFK